VIDLTTPPMAHARVYELLARSDRSGSFSPVVNRELPQHARPREQAARLQMTRSIANWTPYGSGATATARPDWEYVHAEFEKLCRSEIAAAIPSTKQRLK
jgi:hypothetical protein